MTVELEHAEFLEHIVLTGEDVKAVNTADEERIRSVSVHDDGMISVLPPKSWNVIWYSIQQQ